MDACSGNNGAAAIHESLTCKSKDLRITDIEKVTI
jgi:hypothetical protein